MVWLKFDLFPQDVDALGTLNVQATFVNVKTHVPYYNLKVRFLAVFVYLQFLITLLKMKYYKQLLNEGFVISRIIKVEVGVISRSRRLKTLAFWFSI